MTLNRKKTHHIRIYEESYNALMNRKIAPSISIADTVWQVLRELEERAKKAEESEEPEKKRKPRKTKPTLTERIENLVSEYSESMGEDAVRIELSKADDWAETKGATYKDQVAFYRNWLKRAQKNFITSGFSSYKGPQYTIADPENIDDWAYCSEIFKR